MEGGLDMDNGYRGTGHLVQKTKSSRPEGRKLEVRVQISSIGIFAKSRTKLVNVCLLHFSLIYSLW